MELTCTRCKVTQPEDSFSRVNNPKQKRNGRYSWCRDCVSKTNRKWREANPAYIKAYGYRYWREGGERVRAASRAKSVAYLAKARVKIRERYGKACVCCGESASELLTLDHIGGGGNKHRKSLGVGGVQFYLWLIKRGLPDGYRTLCFNCNAARGAYGYCPHEKFDPMTLIGACA